jgi:hypothetical protein
VIYHHVLRLSIVTLESLPPFYFVGIPETAAAAGSRMDGPMYVIGHALSFKMCPHEHREESELTVRFVLDSNNEISRLDRPDEFARERERSFSFDDMVFRDRYS